MKKPVNLVLTASVFATSVLILSAAFTHTPAVSAQSDPAPNTEAYYTQKVLPILDRNCYGCHGAPNHRGGLQMNTRESFYRGGRDGAVISPGHPEDSLLIKLIRHEGPADDPMPMPPCGAKLSDADIATVTAWVKAGAVMPKDSPAPTASPATDSK